MNRIDETWRPHPGALVQIWDYAHHKDLQDPCIVGHGLVGYVVKQSGGTNIYSSDSPGPIFEVIVFDGENESARHNVWHGWLREIKKTSDIKKLIDNDDSL